MAKSGKKKQKKANRKAVRTIVKTVRAPPRVITKVVNAKPKKSLGSRIGGKLGSFVGAGAQALFKHVTGFGDYKISGNSLMAGQVPMVNNVTTSGGTIVRHREYIGDIVPTTNFNLTSYTLNPGNSNLFPWLSALASSYEEYAFRGLIFEYKAMSGSAFLGTAGNVGLGTVIMATQYNVLFPNFPDKRTMENYEFACSNKPNQDFIHPIECDPKKAVLEHLYVNASGQSELGDARFYDLGNFQVATQGFDSAATGIIGELWATYEVELFKPKLNQTLGVSIPTDYFTGLGTISLAQPIPANSTTADGHSTNPGSTCGCFFSISGNNLVMFWPKQCVGTYIIAVTFQFSAQSTTAQFLATAANGGATIVYQQPTVSVSSPGTPNGQNYICMVTLNNDIPDQNASVTFGWNATTITTAVQLNWVTTQIAYSILNPPALSASVPGVSKLQKQLEDLKRDFNQLTFNGGLAKRVHEIIQEEKRDEPNLEGLQRILRDHVSPTITHTSTSEDDEDNFRVVRTSRRKV